MRLLNLFVVAFGIGVVSYPVMHMTGTGPFFVDGGKKQAEPAPRPERRKTAFGLLEQIESDIAASRQKEYRIVINVPMTRLTLYEDEVPAMEVPIAVGQEIYKTPVGHDELKELIWNPWWYPPKSDWAKDEVITPPGPRNPLGPVKMVLGGDIRMHGTTKDSSIGRAASHGCIRMHSKDAIALAWYLQSHLSKQTDPLLFDKYKKYASSTFHVKLDRSVPVDIIYDPIALNEYEVTIYPDIYKKIKDLASAIEWKLFSYGIDPWKINMTLIKERLDAQPSKEPRRVSFTPINE